MWLVTGGSGLPAIVPLAGDTPSVSLTVIGSFAAKPVPSIWNDVTI